MTGTLLTIILLVVVVKFSFICWILWVVFKPDIKKMRQPEEPDPNPTCIYCRSRYTHPTGEVETRWDEGVLLVVTTYECEHCHFPTQHIERVHVGAARH